MPTADRPRGGDPLLLLLAMAMAALVMVSPVTVTKALVGIDFRNRRSVRNR